MEKRVLSLEDYYRTQPPQQINTPKIGAVLEYLIFSGTPLYLSLAKENGAVQKIEEAAVAVDSTEQEVILECSGLKMVPEKNSQVEVTFGYKRKRAGFQTTLIAVEGNNLRVVLPKEILLTNLRRNPRISIASSAEAKFSVKIKAETSVGPIVIDRAEAYEVSQLGMSLFVDRSKGLILPGDRIDSLDIEFNDSPVLRISGVVSRVNMKRRSPSIENSYEIVVLFQKRNTPFKMGEIARSAKRTPVLDQKPCFFSAEHPFFPGRKIEGQVFEISTSGLSCILERTSFPVIPGMRFKNCQLQLPHRPQRELTFEIAHVDFRTDGQMTQFKIGGEFVQAPVELIKDITSYAQDAQGGLIQDVTEDDLDLLWEFMFETNFIYQSKRKQIQNKSREILETHHRLISADNSIVKKMVFKEGAEIKGHISALRFYDDAWIIQHLNALKASGTSAAQAILQAITDFFYDKKANIRNATNYCISFFRPDNMYPALLFGESSRRINDVNKSCCIDFLYGTRSEIQMVNHETQTPEIAIDASNSYRELVDTLVNANLFSLVRAFGLSRPEPGKLGLSAEYAALQLRRERHILSTEMNSVTVFALVEVSSSGLNLSELTNAIYIFSNDPQSELSAFLAEKLIIEAHKKFFEPLEILPAVMQPASYVRPNGINWTKIYTCWVVSGQAIPDFETHSKTVLKDFKELVQAFRTKTQENIKAQNLG